MTLTTIRATVIADSISPQGHRLTTMQLRYPMIIHGELMTHRVFSRNASSTRAIPTKRMIEQVKEDPFVPIWWGQNEPGMQANAELDSDSMAIAKKIWMEACEDAVAHASDLMMLGAHKQLANRVLMPFLHIDVIVSSTQWNNWNALRCHKDAEPHIRMLANTMASELGKSDPVKLKPGNWHLPYIVHEDEQALAEWFVDHEELEPTPTRWVDILLKMSVARCAWVSYTDPTGKQATIDQEIALHDKLVVSQPLHATPAEHQATPDVLAPVADRWRTWENAHRHGNFTGWVQYRKTLPNEWVPG